MKKAFAWSVPVAALVTGLALTLPGPAAASSARPVSQPPYAALQGAALNGVLAVSEGNVWAVGLYRFNSLIEHWNGTRWSQPRIGPGSLSGVAGSSARDIWAVGAVINQTGTATYIPQTLAEHWNGKTWTQVSTPHQASGATFNGVAATSPTNAWAVGTIEGHGPGVFPNTPLIEHWNGKTWS